MAYYFKLIASLVGIFSQILALLEHSNVCAISTTIFCYFFSNPLNILWPYYVHIT